MNFSCRYPKSKRERQRVGLVGSCLVARINWRCNAFANNGQGISSYVEYNINYITLIVTNNNHHYSYHRHNRINHNGYNFM